MQMRPFTEFFHAVSNFVLQRFAGRYPRGERGLKTPRSERQRRQFWSLPTQEGGLPATTCLSNAHVNELFYLYAPTGAGEA